eukprot:TRINITY_DN14525_c1_g2_i1.p1 TRINITY_DN14525_c1_g2~~TRINITY_DN14525_c1_g2_i1.p1  ORF type:complete len:599 (+),score=166.59 TRINITY_DN14525_c1_g2_i1:59-1855(+)
MWGNAARRALMRGVLGTAAAGVGFGGCCTWAKEGRTQCQSLGVVPAEPGKRRRSNRDLPTLTVADVLNDHNGRIWVTFKGGVYDVTDFLDAHPGGPARIEMVQSQDLHAFWSLYTLHLERQHILDLLEEYRIGNLSPADAKRMEELTQPLFSMYKDDPDRPRAKEGKLRNPSTIPWNSEPKDLNVLTDTFFTPNDLFFTRNHNNAPEIERNEYTLEVEENPAAGITKTHTFTLEQLETLFPKHEVVAALQCAGNRQEDFVTKDRPLYVAPHWRNGAIGNARWEGVKVRDVLRHCGMDVDGMALGTKNYPDVKICNFIAEDADETGTPYAGVLPVEKVVDPFGDALLAYKMNGDTLPRDHGYPIRLLAPGHAGCRNVKWVRNIVLSKQASELDSGSKLDRHFAPDVDFMDHIRWGEEHLRLDQGPVIQTLPVTSVICDPPMYGTVWGKNVKDITVKGIAYSGGGRGICRAEVSLDGGKTFTAAEKIPRPTEVKKGVEPQAGQGRNWAWEQFSETIPLPDDVLQKLHKGQKTDIEIVMRAIDGDFNKQPEHMEQAWNVLGICANHWARVNVTLDPSLKPGDKLPSPPPTPPPGYPYSTRD